MGSKDFLQNLRAIQMSLSPIIPQIVSSGVRGYYVCLCLSAEQQGSDWRGSAAAAHCEHAVSVQPAERCHRILQLQPALQDRSGHPGDVGEHSEGRAQVGALASPLPRGWRAQHPGYCYQSRTPWGPNCLLPSCSKGKIQSWLQWNLRVAGNSTFQNLMQFEFFLITFPLCTTLCRCTWWSLQSGIYFVSWPQVKLLQQAKSGSPAIIKPWRRNHLISANLRVVLQT